MSSDLTFAAILLFTLWLFTLALVGGALLTVLRLSREFTLTTRDLAEFIKADSLTEKVQLDEARKSQPEQGPEPQTSPATPQDLVRQLLETGRPVTDADGHEWEMT